MFLQQGSFQPSVVPTDGFFDPENKEPSRHELRGRSREYPLLVTGGNYAAELDFRLLLVTTRRGLLRPDHRLEKFTKAPAASGTVMK